MTKLYEIVTSGSFDRLLPHLTISNSSGELKEGSGRITWGIESGIRFEGATGGEDADLIGIFNFLHLGNRSLTLSGLSKEGEQISSNQIYERDFGLNSGTDYRIWDVDLQSFTIEDSLLFANPKKVTACFRTIKNIRCVRETNTTNDNPFFRRGQKKFDWLAFYCGYGFVCIEKVDGGNANALIFVKEGIEDHERWLESIRLSISFIESRTIQLVGYETTIDDVRKVKLYRSVRTSKRDFAPPAQECQLTDHENMLGCCVNFFHTEQGRKLSDSLRMCWDVADNYSSVAALVACSAIEALLDILKNRHEMARKATDDQVQEQRKLIVELNKSPDMHGSRFVRRVSGLLNDKSKVDVNFVLDDWAKRGLMNIEMEDVKAWKELRHPVSHGALLFNVFHDNSVEVNRQKYFRVLNLLNKLTLQAIGYTGSHYDQRTYTTSEFKAVPTEVL